MTWYATEPAARDPKKLEDFAALMSLTVEEVRLVESDPTFGPDVVACARDLLALHVPEIFAAALANSLDKKRADQHAWMLLVLKFAEVGMPAHNLKEMGFK